MKKCMIVFGLLFLFGCSGTSAPRRACETYLRNFQQGNFSAMWKALSSEQKRKIGNQLAVAKSGKGMHILTRGLVDVSQVKNLSPQEYFIQIIQTYKKILQDKESARKIFDLLSAHVEKVTLRGKLAIATLFDGANRKKMVLIKEKDSWKIDGEYLYMEEEKPNKKGKM